jgi:hypothetical protein
MSADRRKAERVGQRSRRAAEVDAPASQVRSDFPQQDHVAAEPKNRKKFVGTTQELTRLTKK